MTKPNIALLIGSLSRESINRRLGEALRSQGGERFDIREVSLADLPLFNRDLDGALPRPVLRFKAEIDAAGGIADAATQRFLDGFLMRFLHHVERFGKVAA